MIIALITVDIIQSSSHGSGSVALFGWDLRLVPTWGGVYPEGDGAESLAREFQFRLWSRALSLRFWYSYALHWKEEGEFVTDAPVRSNDPDSQRRHTRRREPNSRPRSYIPWRRADRFWPTSTNTSDTLYAQSSSSWLVASLPRYKSQPSASLSFLYIPKHSTTIQLVWSRHSGFRLLLPKVRCILNHHPIWLDTSLLIWRQSFLSARLLQIISEVIEFKFSKALIWSMSWRIL